MTLHDLPPGTTAREAAAYLSYADGVCARGFADMTRGVSPGSPTRYPAGVGPGEARGLLPLPAPPAPAFSLPLTWCRGRICLACGLSIRRYGVRLGNQWIETYAHGRCAEAIVRDVPELAP